VEEDIDDAVADAAGDADRPDADQGDDEQAGQGEDEQVETTGEPRVDEALRRLGELGDLPVSEHPPIFERVHASLVDVLGELRSGVADDAGRGTDRQRVDPQH
jgi:hypothetical protein